MQRSLRLNTDGILQVMITRSDVKSVIGKYEM